LADETSAARSRVIGRQQCDDRGMPDCQSGATLCVSCGTILCIAVASDIEVCHADCHWDKSRNGLCGKGCGSGIDARLFPEKETGMGCRNCTVDKLASITLGVTARLIGSERAWAGTTTVGRSL